jgi:ribonuclease BN (tRNA processing enzyme)
VYEKYDAKPASGIDCALAIARGWSSAVPLVASEDRTSGGGYFLRWGGTGMVIDPGLDFLENFRNMGFHYGEIDAAVVSHNHTDHNFDLRALDDVMYELNSAARRLRGSGVRSYRYQIVWDADTANAHKNLDPDKPEEWEQIKHRLKPLRFDLSMRERDILSDIPLGVPGINLPYSLGFFRVRHTPDVSNAVGLRITCQPRNRQKKPVTIGFTCDTGYTDQLCDPKALNGCDILVAHISQPNAKEYRNRDFIKEAHLGYRGLARLLEKLPKKPKLTLVGEFWAGLTDLRIDLVHGLRELAGISSIMPTSVGMLVNPETLQIRCSSCRLWTAHDAISIASPSQIFGPLRYLCPNCTL